MKASGRFCTNHGGDVSVYDSWLCDTCAREGINKCSCGSHARSFGEALMCSVSCESCKEYVMFIGMKPSVRDMWNKGLRGNIELVEGELLSVKIRS